MDILIGADPEVFVKNPNSEDFITAFGLIPGTKHEPFAVKDGAVQVDGCALEFNIDPASSAKAFCGNIRSVYDQMAAMVPGYNVVVEPFAVFDQSYFADVVPPQAKELGCDPDFDGWTGKANRPPKNTQPQRSAGGHVHIGWTTGKDINDPEWFKTCRAVARQLDYYLGIHSLLWDQDDRRRKMYGRAGCFRPKHYGMEYRTMSNAWLKSDYLVHWVFHAAKLGITDFLAGTSAEAQWGDMAQHIINSNTLDWPDHMDITIPKLPMPPKLKAA